MVLTGRRGLVAALALVLFVFLGIPILSIIQTSLGSPPDVSAYAQIAGTSVDRTILVNTFQIAAIATVLTLVLGFGFALYLWYQRGVWRWVAAAAIFVPFFTGVLVKNFSWTVLLRNTGVVNAVLTTAGLPPLDLLFTRTAVYVGMVNYLLPFAVLPIYASLLRIDPSFLLAARSLGAGRAYASAAIILPLAFPGIIAATVVVFITGLGFFVTPAMLGGRADQMVANIISVYTNRLGDFQTSAAFACILMLAVLALAPLALRQLRSRQGAGVGALFDPGRTDGAEPVRVVADDETV